MERPERQPLTHLSSPKGPSEPCADALGFPSSPSVLLHYRESKYPADPQSMKANLAVKCVLSR